MDRAGRRSRAVGLRLFALLVGLAACSSASRSPEAGTGVTAGTAVSDTLLAVAGTRLFVHREGSGPPLVVVHGGPVLDHGYLVEPLRPLAAEYTLVFFDQRLSGRSAGRVDSGSVTLTRFAEDIEAVREALGLGRIHLLGHSWGGLLALKYAEAHPAALRSLILVSPMAPSAELWRAEERMVGEQLTPADTAGMGALRSSAAIQVGDPAAIERLLQLSFRAQLHDPALADQLHFHIGDDYGERSRQFSRLAGELGSYDLTAELPGLMVPTLLIYGAEEVGAELGGDVLREALPDGTVEVVPAAKHFVFLERPEAFRRIVLSFLSR